MRFAIRLFVVAVFAATATMAAFADEPSGRAAPFGLTWGMSVAQVKSLGVELAEQTGMSGGRSFIATKLPKVLSDASTVFLFFGFDDKLWRIAAISRDFRNDPYGNSVRERYDELAKELGDKYGHAEPHQSLDGRLYNKASEFVMGIKVGRSWWYTNFDAPTLWVQLGIGASDMDTAYWRIIFEDKPLRAEFEKSKKTHEKDAL